MTIDLAHAGPTILTAFLASGVEFVEALTVVLAVGTVRGWRGALGGSALAVALLAAIVALLGPALTLIPLAILQLAVGALLLLFGLRWLRKAVLRAVGAIPRHDEAATYARETARLRALGPSQGWDTVATVTAFQITMLEGMEVVFIVVAIGAAGSGLLGPACLGAALALAAVLILGAALHRPLARIPENTLKFVVGVMLSGFGAFWVGEGLQIGWPGGDWAILLLTAGFLAAALLAIASARGRLASASAR